MESDHPDAGRLRQTRTPAEFLGTPPDHRYGAPRLGAHTGEVLREAGFSEAEIAALLESGAAVADPRPDNEG